VRDQFLSDDHSKTIEQINQAFQKWLSQYHETIHSTLQCSPLKKRLQSQNLCRAVPEVADIEALFRMERRCRLYKDSTIRLFNQRFEVPGSLPNSRITIFYMPWDLSRVYYGQDMKLAIPLNTSANARRFQHPNTPKTGGSL
jgi:hypothetical protein